MRETEREEALKIEKGSMRATKEGAREEAGSVKDRDPIVGVGVGVGVKKEAIRNEVAPKNDQGVAAGTGGGGMIATEVRVRIEVQIEAPEEALEDGVGAGIEARRETGMIEMMMSNLHPQKKMISTQSMTLKR
jgi:hypothetical protein